MLLRLRRKPRYDGFLTLFFGAWYGTGRFIEDFFRVDVTHGTGLTGSQWTALTVTGLCLYCLLVLRDTPWRSGRGAFESIPNRQRGDPADEPVAAARAESESESPGHGEDEPTEAVGESPVPVAADGAESPAEVTREDDSHPEEDAPPLV